MLLHGRFNGRDRLNKETKRWEAQYREADEDFEAACLKTLRAFDSNEALEESFYRAFDSIEVLPACLEDQHHSLMADDAPLEAGQMPVSVSWGQFCKLRKAGLVRDSRYRWLKVVEIPYSSEVGLQVTL